MSLDYVLPYMFGGTRSQPPCSSAAVPGLRGSPVLVQKAGFRPDPAWIRHFRLTQGEKLLGPLPVLRAPLYPVHYYQTLLVAGL